MTRFLFQGDSITDGNRGRGDDPNHIIGHSYPYPIATHMGFTYPERKFEFMNRGCSGNDICDLYARWQSETLNLRPDILSILIGINDACHRCESPEECYVDVFEETYRSLLRRCLTANPDMKFIILEPFTLDTGNLGHHKRLAEYVFQYAAVSRKIAQEFNAVFVPLQERFNAACAKAPVSYWIWDSVHPTYNGHGLIADAFLHDTKEFFDHYPYRD